MLSAISRSGEGIDAAQQKLEITAHNLANIETIGYKKDIVITSTFAKQLIERMDGKNAIKVDIFTSHKQGPLKFTKSEYDVAINGEGFFVLQNEKGDKLYTRNGGFSRDDQGYLTDAMRNRVLDENDAPINIGNGKPEIDDSGTIRLENNVVGKIKIADFERPYKLNKIGNSYFQPVNPREATIKPEHFKVAQGYLELSNVSSIESMIEMVNIINAVRDSETNKKVIQMEDDTLERVINQVGRAMG